jgi:hypothetical protein
VSLQPSGIKRLNVICFYVVLIVLALPVPVQQRQMAQAIEGMRPAFKMDDGTYEGGLLPGDLLAAREIGKLSWIVLMVVSVFFALSFFVNVFARMETVCALAVCQLGYTTFYALCLIMTFLVR